MNTYGYVSSNPVLKTDPLGLAEVCWSWEGQWPHKYICVGEKCAGNWPWPEGMEPDCPNRGIILEETKNLAKFCTSDDGGGGDCEKEEFDQCVLRNIGKAGQCSSYDYITNNCTDWVDDVRESCEWEATKNCVIKRESSK